VPLALDQLRVQSPDTARLRELYLELEFHGLAKSVGDTGASIAPMPATPASAGESQRTYVTVETVAQANEVVAEARRAGRVAFDTETILEAGAPDVVDPLRSILVGLSLCFREDTAYYFPFGHRNRQGAQEALPLGDVAVGESGVGGESPIHNLPALTDPALAAVRDLLEDATVEKTAQNGKYDLLVLRRLGINVQGLKFDTMIASYVLDPGRRSHGLDILSLEFLQHRMTTYDEVAGKGKAAIPFDQVPVERARDYCCDDANVVLRLTALFAEQLEALRLGALLREIEMPLVPVLAEMEWQGITIDLSAFSALKERFARERQRAEQEIYRTAGEEFNINSNAQLREVLFTKLGLPVLKKTATGPSTDASVLQQLADEGHALPALLMEYRELSKLESTYIDTLPALVNPHTGRLHTSFNQTVAATGRLSSSNPNLQNIPIRRELGREIRRAFIPQRGWTMLSADYSQIELRLLAHLSGDPAFVQAFQSGGDIHRETAALIFNVPVEEVTGEMRARAKTINFATIYGQGPFALSQQLKISHADARAFIDQYFTRFTGVRAYLDSTVEFARTNGYAQTIFGRRRYIPELRDRNFNIRAFGERTAQNTPIQGSAADLIKIAMINVARRMRESGLASHMLLQVHDELVFEAPAEEVDALSSLVRTEMEGAASLKVPLVVDIGTGMNWLESK
jgi:DNA polymerase-1